MKKNVASWLGSLLGKKEVAGKVLVPEITYPQPNPETVIGLNHEGFSVPNPLRSFDSHSLILGSTGTGKTALIHRLVKGLGCRTIWLTYDQPEIEAIRGAIANHERFELPVLVVADDIHQFADQLEFIETIARDGIRSNVLLVVSAQLLADLPQAVWRNCQVKFALGQDGCEQLNLPSSAIGRYEIAYHWPGSTGVLKALPQSPFGKVVETSNPLARYALEPQSAPYEGFARVRQIPSDQWSMAELTEPQGPHDRLLGSTDLPHRTRYSRIL